MLKNINEKLFSEKFLDLKKVKSQKKGQQYDVVVRWFLKMFKLAMYEK